MTTRSRGLHTVVPLDRTAEFDVVRGFARDAAALLARRHPRELTVEARMRERAGRLLLDIAGNAYAQTGVAPYAVRAKPGAPVATALAWDELDDRALTARTYHVGNIFRRIERVADPWTGIGRHAQSLAVPGRRLGALCSTLREQSVPSEGRLRPHWVADGHTVRSTPALVQTRKIKPMPIVLMGERYWPRAFDPDFLMAEGVIDLEDVQRYAAAGEPLA
jgi:hypothetical protein